MANTLKFGAGQWATKEGSTLAYNDENDNYKPLPFTFTRASNATVVNKAGLIETVGSDMPRIDYKDDSEGALLLEPQSTNLVTYSEDFSSGWIYDDSTITNNSAISPDGTQNAGLWIGSTVSSRHNIGAVPTPVASVTGSFSLFVKAKELKYVQIASTNTVNQYVNFDVEDGIIGTVGSSFSNAKIENYGNGWYRCSVVSPNQYNGLYISLVSGLNSTWLESWVMPNNADGLYIWGAQLEQGTYATSYIPTQGSAVTRLADSCSQTVPDGVIGQTEGTLYTEINITKLLGATTRSIVRLGSAVDLVDFSFLGTLNNSIRAVIRTSANTRFQAVFEIQSVGVYKLAIGYKSNDSVFYVNGVQINNTINTSFTIPSIEDITYDYSTELNDSVNQTKLYNTRLSNSELQVLTS